jgi:isoleucyl-tRNA synthetase
MSDSQKSFQSQREEEILNFWDEFNCFQRSIDERSPGNPYVFYDGPPFATGLPHYGHLLQSYTKDIVPRYFTMKGFRVERKWGWDCHGLPIEAIVENDFNLKSREEIIAMGVDKFNEACDARIMTYAEEWKKTIRRIGRWVDMDNAYMTKDRNFMESVWWVFKSLHEKGLIYQGYKIMHVSPTLETVLSNFEVNQNYQEITDVSAYVEFPIVNGDFADTRLIAWTTTPWTLPGNTLLAVGENIVYSLVEYEGKKLICAKELLEKAFTDKKFSIIKEFKGSELIGAKYEPPFDYFIDHPNAFRVVHGDFVTVEDGTGIVHIAPAFGSDDLELGQKENVNPIIHVQMNGRFTPEVESALVEAGYDVAGKPVKSKDNHQHVDIEIIKYLAHKGLLFAKKKIVHSYPLCWRTDCPLINYATTSWFVKVTSVKKQMQISNASINWVPDHIKVGRFGKGIENAPDWSISRSRFWGTPLPIWQAEDGEVIVVGSLAELQELSGESPDDLHKHIVDKITIERNGKKFTRIPEVLDCWFESGAMPYAQLHYPFENKEKFDHGFPAEFIAEAQDQTRGWFYTLHVLSNALFKMPAFKNVIVSGLIMAEDGKKMSKRLKNYPDPQYVIDRYGSDALRYYIASSPVVTSENLNFREKDVDEISKKFISIVRNVLSFYELYRSEDDGRQPSNAHVIDTWILSRLAETQVKIESSMEIYNLQEASRSLQPFVTDLSTWYVRRSRERMKGAEGNELQKEALATLRSVLEHFSKILAPFMPFLAEDIYQTINNKFSGQDKNLSVHLELWPELPNIDEKNLADMALARSIVSRALDAREEAGMPIKQALSKMTVTLPDVELADALKSVIVDEVNVKHIIAERGEFAVTLDFSLTPELKREGMARDLIRKINSLRKDLNLTVKDRINLHISSESEQVELMLEEHSEDICYSTQSDEILNTSIPSSQNVRIAEQDLQLGIVTKN